MYFPNNPKDILNSAPRISHTLINLIQLPLRVAQHSERAVSHDTFKLKGLEKPPVLDHFTILSVSVPRNEEIQ